MKLCASNIKWKPGKNCRACRYDSPSSATNKKQSGQVSPFCFLSGSRESPPEDGRASGAEPCLAQFVKRKFVEEQGIEPCLHEPESCVLPAYSSPQSKSIIASYLNFSNQSRKIRRNNFLQCRAGDGRAKANFSAKNYALCKKRQCNALIKPPNISFLSSDRA